MFTARRKKFVFLTWILILAGLGSAAPSVFDDLAGAGWQANNSESVQVRELAKEHFGGNASSAIQVVIHTPEGSISDPQAQETIKQVTSTLDGDERISAIIPPQQGSSISPDGKTGILIAGANANTDDMVRAVDQHKSELTALSTPEVEVYPTGSSALWSDFNKANHDAMIKAEMMSWPITLIILIIAFSKVPLPDGGNRLIPHYGEGDVLVIVHKRGVRREKTGFFWLNGVGINGQGIIICTVSQWPRRAHTLQTEGFLFTLARR